jgi:hypothetical protein
MFEWLTNLFGGKKSEPKYGVLSLVVNKGKYKSANKDYWHVKVQLKSSDLSVTDVDLLLTDHEVNRAVERAVKNPEDVNDE